MAGNHAGVKDNPDGTSGEKRISFPCGALLIKQS